MSATAALATAYPSLTRGRSPHPALAGCEDVAWSAVPGCPKDVPVVLRGLLDPDAAEQAESVLGWILLSGPMAISAATPAFVPFLLRLAADPSVPRRGELFGLVLVVAALSEPSDPGNAWSLALSGAEQDHPERRLCRASFAADAALVLGLLADEELSAASSLSEDDRTSLLRAAGL
ncbi:hypothetical protein [Actinacidiphila yeochonensis]|uniref:hypothetical protein n=1 Tax=Actinacidiphila yeochonensis TaxID=89050 RepID=UPI001E53E1FE|nr:hypothetical protein [Actinacidiphila yeochonensis]